MSFERVRWLGQELTPAENMAAKVQKKGSINIHMNGFESIRKGEL
jgi:hypothetical protein